MKEDIARIIKIIRVQIIVDCRSRHEALFLAGVPDTGSNGQPFIYLVVYIRKPGIVLCIDLKIGGEAAHAEIGYAVSRPAHEGGSMVGQEKAADDPAECPAIVRRGKAEFIEEAFGIPAQ